MKIGNLPAFPSHGSMGEVVQEGMTLRQYYAGQAMAGLCNAHSQDGTWAHDAKDVAVSAFQYADALLAELEKQNDQA